jgi:hypothetical protein
MKRRKSIAAEPVHADLRRNAEERLKALQETAGDPPAVQSARDGDRLVHELEVHQIELEVQNEDLRRARLELETALVDANPAHGRPASAGTPVERLGIQPDGGCPFFRAKRAWPSGALQAMLSA